MQMQRLVAYSGVRDMHSLYCNALVDVERLLMLLLRCRLQDNRSCTYSQGPFHACLPTFEVSSSAAHHNASGAGV
jgi:hypothetical protein